MGFVPLRQSSNVATKSKSKQASNCSGKELTETKGPTLFSKFKMA